MSGEQGPSMEQYYTGQFHQPKMPSGPVESTEKDFLEEEPPLLEGKNIVSSYRIMTNICFQLLCTATSVVFT